MPGRVSPFFKSEERNSESGEGRAMESIILKIYNVKSRKLILRLFVIYYLQCFLFALHSSLFALYTATLNSRSASFKLVFRSVLGLRCPMINAQGTWNSPAGNFFG